MCEAVTVRFIQIILTARTKLQNGYEIRYAVEKCIISVRIIIFTLVVCLTKNPFDKTKGDKHNNRRDIYSSYRRNDTPDRFENRLRYYVKNCYNLIMWIVGNPR